jgi:hypothetical protein
MKVLNTIMAWCAPLFRGKKNKEPDWNEIEYFHESWKNRIKTMAAYIHNNSSVLDLGSGKEWLREFLPAQVRYTAVDYCDRGTSNLVCDFNLYQFPGTRADYAFISGCLEYIVDYNWFAEKVCAQAGTVIVSYNTKELVPDEQERKGLAWKNHLTESELVQLFTSKQMRLDLVDRSISKNTIFIFKASAA